jgi:hypothetical protein
MSRAVPVRGPAASMRVSSSREWRLAEPAAGEAEAGRETSETRRSSDDRSTAIVRVEQLYPLPSEEIRAELAKYPNAEVVWAQDRRRAPRG